MYTDNNKQTFGNIKKKHFRPILQWMIRMTLDCVNLTQIIHRNAGLKCFFTFLNACYYHWFLLTFIFHKAV